MVYADDLANVLKLGNLDLFLNCVQEGNKEYQYYIGNDKSALMVIKHVRKIDIKKI